MESILLTEQVQVTLLGTKAGCYIIIIIDWFSNLQHNHWQAACRQLPDPASASSASNGMKAPISHLFNHAKLLHTPSSM
jgi:hypothetical protein